MGLVGLMLARSIRLQPRPTGWPCSVQLAREWSIHLKRLQNRSWSFLRHHHPLIKGKNSTRVNLRLNLKPKSKRFLRFKVMNHLRFKK